MNIICIYYIFKYYLSSDNIIYLFSSVPIWCFPVFLIMNRNILFKYSCLLLFWKFKVLISCWTDVCRLSLIWVRYWANVSQSTKNYFKRSHLFINNRRSTNYIQGFPIKFWYFFIVWVKYPLPNNTDITIHINWSFHQF